MKQFVSSHGSNVDGVLLSENEPPRKAIFLTPGQAKFMAAFKSVQASK